MSERLPYLGAYYKTRTRKEGRKRIKTFQVYITLRDGREVVRKGYMTRTGDVKEVRFRLKNQDYSIKA